MNKHSELLKLTFINTGINELFAHFCTDHVFKSIRDLWSSGFLNDRDALALVKDIRDLELGFDISDTPSSVIDEIDQFIFMLEGSYFHARRIRKINKFFKPIK
jgi:hypothetical protein